MMYVGGGLAVAYLLFSNTGAAASLQSVISPAAPATVIPNGAGAETVAIPAGGTAVTADAAAQVANGYPYLVQGSPLPIPNPMVKAYYLAYIYPAMKVANPNIANPSYQLTTSEAQQYGANYQSIQVWANDVVNIHKQPHMTDIITAYKFHWKTYGVVDQNTFLPLPAVFPNDYVVAPVVPKAKSGNFLSSALSVLGTAAQIAVKIVGVNDDDDTLTDGDVELLVTGNYIVSNMLPMFAKDDRALSVAIGDKINSVINDYL